MRKIIISSIFIFIAINATAQTKWKIAGDKITTQWAKDVKPENVLPEYPRPQMVRNNKWINLNGLWQYAILPVANEISIPSNFQGNILVPFAVESALSGVGKTVGKDSILWYQRAVKLNVAKKNEKILLHFGAVDWRSEIFVNGKSVFMHEGGYDPFTVDITSALKKGATQQIAVRGWDPTNDGTQPNGKQQSNPNGIWYTSVTGIWQTVWIEIVPATYISSTKQTPDIDKGTIAVQTNAANLQPGDIVSASAWKGNEKIAEQNGSAAAITLPIPQAELWSPEHPFLYDLKIAIIRKGKIIDEVKSYFAMRKISRAADKNGIQRIMLNNKFVFEHGPLDQGWWPDGLYTAPTDEALKFDIERTKEMGFNLIRKHVKVEPARWYYHCDQLGMLVWQDMPSGDVGGNFWEGDPGIYGRATEKNRTPESEADYRKEWNAIMDALYDFPCIVVWVPFNEAWGQFKTPEITAWTKQKDPSRLVNAASGGNYFFGVGDIMDVHHYPDPVMPTPDIFGKQTALVLGEYGGLGLPVEGHTWNNKGWGYQSFKTSAELFERYKTLNKKLEELIKAGLSAAVYTQTTDVEGEINGIMTYDRKVMKMPLEELKNSNLKLTAVPVN
jgi:beta-galactosidase/beta-glucuronidase